MNLSTLRPYNFDVSITPSEMNKHAAELYFNEFMQKLKPSAQYFKGVLLAEGLLLENSVKDLTVAAEWIVKHARKSWVRSEVHPQFRLAPFERDLSVPTKSACCYLGLLFGELMVEKVETASWVLYRNDKREIYYNHPVVYVPGAKIGPLEPISVSMNYVSSRLDKTHPFHNRLFDELFDYWYSCFSTVDS